MAEADKQFLLPPPKFKDEVKKSLDSFSRHLNPHFSTPSGMLLTRDKQPPPMYGPRGSTVPPRFLGNPRKRPAEGSPSNHGNNRQMQPGGFQSNYKGGKHNRPPRPPNNHGFDKEVKPELLVLDWKLWCERCDINCRSEEEYRQHLSNHTPCTVPGCKFVGHPMIMKRHERQTHRDDGGSKEPAVGPSAEEIEQWKEERRKRYPTKQNVILRQHAQEVRFNRGERIEENRDRFPKRPSATNDEARENGPRRDNGPPTARWKRPKGRKRTLRPAPVPVVEEYPGRISFKGTSLLKDYKDPPVNSLTLLGDYGSGSESGSDDEELANEAVEKPKASIEQTSTKQSIVESENVLSEGEIVGNEITNNEINCNLDGYTRPVIEVETEPISTKTANVPNNTVEIIDEANQQKPQICVATGSSKNTSTEENSSQQISKNNVPNGPSTSVSSSSAGIRPKQQNPKRGNTFKAELVTKRNRPLLDYSKLRRSNQNTMLEKLLDSDIRHERNVLLQCVRHVIVNKFFGVGQPKEKNATAPDVSNVSQDAKE
ncbi:nuclear fragile X mental retardation-interacting protein 1 [Anopheles stephensi]|uniref:nuclear fragile X mental retardation-interacting protein 1 n=1 Tax=Anopheles stephensi TaxID=30069 RepID=UPI0016588D6D|nr:nuclear fragile X mental retardation-interacting protein 1 [Anopheles stephensi]